MAKISNLFPSKYVKVTDLGGRPHRVTIAGVEVEPIGREKELKPVLLFRSSELKPLVLNVTNSKTISAAFGEETDDWTGQTIELYPSETSFGNEVVEWIRVRIPKQSGSNPITSTPVEEDPPPLGVDF